ncbi:YfhO family protein [Lapillicoccus jejuensis]|uniref:Membrane protein YfhO n=1 Tax=Lapillicoccus jejuensis TaxID=402171 RepID=A0A542DVX8_9MICO|nr:YfhO family protein [Lapillicoccus jejuensis]TQJ07247.1 membrane protein YfhO [Lapillicoccus jejuensis]
MPSPPATERPGRRPARSRRPSAATLLGVLAVALPVLVVLGPALLGRGVLADTALLTRFAPWSAADGTRVATTNLCRSDIVDSVLPTMAELRRQVAGGRYPQWNPWPVGGAPVAGPDYGQWSPFALPLWVLPLTLAPAWLVLTQLAAVVAGTLAWLRRLGVPTGAGLVAGSAVATSGWMVGWAQWPQARVGALVPALFWAAERLVQRRDRGSAVAVALVVAGLLLGGFPAVTALAVYAAGAYVVARLAARHLVGARRPGAWREVGRGLAWGGVGVALGAAVTAFTMLPFVLRLRETDLAYRESYTGTHEALRTLVTAAAPGSQGLCVGSLPSSGVLPVESVTYVGAATLVLALVGALAPRRPRSRRGVVGFLVVAVAVTVVAGWLGGPLLWLVQKLPGLAANPIARVRAVLEVLLVALAALGLERLLRPPPGVAGPRRRRRWAFTAAVATLAAVVTVAALVDGVRDAVAKRYVDLFAPEVAWAAGVGLVAAVAVVVALRTGRRPVRLAAVAVVVLLVAGQGTAYAARALRTSPEGTFYPVTASHAFLQGVAGSDRVASSDFLAYPSTLPWYRLRTPVGHQFLSEPWRAYLLAVDPRVQLVPTLTDFSSRSLPLADVGRSPLLDRLAVRWWLAPGDEVPGTVRPARAPSPAGRVAVAAGRPVTCGVAAGGVRAVVVTTATALRRDPRAGTAPAAVTVTLDGATGGRTLPDDVPAGTALVVPVPAETRTGAGAATLTFTGIAAGALDGGGDQVRCGTVAPAADGLRLAQAAPGATVWERTTALPRVRWADRALRVADERAALAALAAGVPDDTVVLPGGDDGTGDGGASSGWGAVTVTTDDTGVVAASVDHPRAGWLVVADNLQAPGWSVTVDGRPATLRPADGAFGAVAVPAGRHEVRFAYAAPGLRVGALVSLGALAVLVILLASGVAARRRARTRG